MATFDLHVAKLDFDESFRTRVLSFTNSQLNGKVVLVSGIYSVVNKWIMAFLTPKYSDPLDLEYGSTFSDLVYGVSDKSEIYSVSQIAVQEANTTLRRMQKGIPLDATQLFKDAVLTGILSNPDYNGFDLYIKISNLNNDKITITVPTLTELL